MRLGEPGFRKGVPKSAAHRAAISAAHQARRALGLKRRALSPEGRARLSEVQQRFAVERGSAYYSALGRGQRSERTRERMRKPKSEAHRAAIQKSKIGRARPEISGPRNSRWNGGVYKRKPNPARIDIAARGWKRAVLARDGACQRCSATEQLHAHHIKPLSRYPELRADLDNGVALCGSCHRHVHRTNDPAFLFVEQAPS